MVGVFTQIFTSLFGGRRNIVKETAEVFRENAEAGAQRSFDLDAATVSQLAAEFQYRGKRTWFDSLMDGLNRLPRPMMVFGVFGLLVYTPMDPVRMAEVFAAWALIPGGMWAVVGVIVSFFFGGRSQLKDQDFQRELAETMTRVPVVVENMESIREMDPGEAEAHDLEEVGDNPALSAWKTSAPTGG